MRNYFFITFLLFVTACAGTGTKNYSAISYEAPSDQAVLFVGRKNRFMASGALPKILLDGREIAKLGIGEMERVNVSAGSHFGGFLNFTYDSSQETLDTIGTRFVSEFNTSTRQC